MLRGCSNVQLDYEVTTPLPNITFDIGRSYAGNIPIARGEDLSLFYWAVESQNGSLTSENVTEPWHIWLNGFVIKISPAMNLFTKL